MSSKVTFVESLEEAHSFLRWLGESRPVLAIDTETTGLRPYHTDQLRITSFAGVDESYVVSNLRWRGVIEKALREYQGQVVFHNAIFDLGFFKAHGYPLPARHQVNDTMILDHLIDPGRSHTLDQCARRELPAMRKLNFKKYMLENGYTWATVPENNEFYYGYCGLDAIITAQVWEQLSTTLGNFGDVSQVAYDREMSVVDICLQMGHNGIGINEGKVEDLAEEYDRQINELRKNLHNFNVQNPNSRAQIEAALRVEIDWEPEDFTLSGEVSTTKKVLQGLESQVAEMVLELRRLSKLKSSYLDVFMAEADVNGRCHPEYRTLRARTGRMSVARPAFQTLPRGSKIREYVIAGEGNKLVSIDLDGIEMRILAHYSQDPTLLSALRAGEDVHLATAKTLYKDQGMAKSDPRRQLAKNTNFCIVYGGGPSKVAETAGVELSVAQEIMDRYASSMSGVSRLMDSVSAKGMERLEAGQQPHINTWGGRVANSARTKIYTLTNYLIQGSAADVMKEMMLGLDAAGLTDYMRMIVHDEVLFEFPEKDAVELTKESSAQMTWTDRLSVPITASASEPGSNWGVLK